MPSYVKPPVRPAMLLLPLVLGLAIGVAGWPSELIAAESVAEQVESAPSEAAPDEPAADAEKPAAAEEPAASEEPVAEPAGAEPEASEPMAGQAEEEPEAAEPEAEGEPEDAEEEGPELESLSGKSLLELLWDAKTTLSVLNANGDDTRVEVGLGRTLFTLFLAVLSLAVLIGPFYFAIKLTKEWREPLWCWPVGLVFLGVAGVGLAFLVRLLLAPLDESYGYDFLRFLLHVVLIRNLWIAVGLVAVSMWLGNYLAHRWRMPDHAVRIGVVFFCLLAGLAISILGWPPHLGIDLSGGVILVYDLKDDRGSPQGGGGEAQENEGEAEGDEEEEGAAAAGTQKVDMEKLIQAIRLRVDPSNTRELTIREYGERQIEVIIPQADEEELARIKKKISSAGTLEFRILANRRDHPSLIERALELEGWNLNDSKGNSEARWVPVARGEEEGLVSLSVSAETVFRNKTYRGYEWTEFLVVKDVFDVTGGYLVQAREDIDPSARPCVMFRFNHRGGQLFGALTGDNTPNDSDGFSRHLGIILDDYLNSAPAIRSPIFRQGEITGDFTRQEVQDLVDILNAGSLPTALSEEPISETFMGPGLGQDTIERGKIAIMVSMGLVLLFMLYYYRFAGIVACFALLLNLVLILAVMITIRAAFTLPGLAGLVLTVGMAVDANVLIFERIREELNRQATLRMAIRNGFARATTTIVDANLTTLIVA
ncbi:MAG: protein translocase subunit SecD, partial [Planctomycetes bacterium]|nr:protein translocase subunit SecD [Planctomycetota bacterium]